jgi:hypothetical protein
LFSWILIVERSSSSTLVCRYGVPARLVVGHVAVLAPASEREVDRRGVDCGAHALDRGGQQPVPLRLRHLQALRDPTVEALLHEALEVVRVPARQRPPLPVEALVHVEDVEPRERDAAAVHLLGPRRVPGRRPARHDHARVLAGAVALVHEVDELARHQPAHLAPVPDDAQGHAALRVLLQLLGGDAAPLEQVARPDAVAHQSSSTS